MQISKTEQEFIEDWKQKREMGVFKFMLIPGGIFGLIMTITILVIELYDNSFKEIFLSSNFLFQVLLAFVISIVGCGGIMWIINNRRYKKNQEKK